MYDLCISENTTVLKRKQIVTAAEIAGHRIQEIYSDVLKPEYRVKDKYGLYDIAPLIGDSVNFQEEEEESGWSLDSISSGEIDNSKEIDISDISEDVESINYMEYIGEAYKEYIETSNYYQDY
jgi:hypothetical protein